MMPSHAAAFALLLTSALSAHVPHPAVVQDAAGASKWIVSEGLSKSTRQPRTVARLPADRPIRGQAGPVMPLLALECHGGQLSAYVHAGIGRLGAPPLLVAWDDGEPQEDWSWMPLPKGSTLESSTPAGFIHALTTSTRVHIELRPRSTSRQMVSFTLKGVEAVVQQLGSACVVAPSVV